MAAIRGNVINAVHKVANPNFAPACEYVAIPEGSSSLAPVISPGPRIFKNRFKLDCLDFLVSDLLFINYYL
jgi:hypothetical protein